MYHHKLYKYKNLLWYNLKIDRSDVCHVLTPGYVITYLPFKQDGYFIADGNKTGQQ